MVTTARTFASREPRAQLLVKVMTVLAVVAVLEVTVTVMLDGQPEFAPIPETSTGVVREAVVPSPSWPEPP